MYCSAGNDFDHITKDGKCIFISGGSCIFLHNFIVRGTIDKLEDCKYFSKEKVKKSEPNQVNM